MSQRRVIFATFKGGGVRVKVYGSQPVLVASISENQNQEYSMFWDDQNRWLRVWSLRWPGLQGKEVPKAQVSVAFESQIESMMFEDDVVELKKPGAVATKAA